MQVIYGNSDYGVLAVAFATALCSGKELTKINFIQHQLRTHLKNCLLGNNITDFPPTQRKWVRELHICSIYGALVLQSNNQLLVEASTYVAIAGGHQCS